MKQEEIRNWQEKLQAEGKKSNKLLVANPNAKTAYLNKQREEQIDMQKTIQKLNEDIKVAKKQHTDEVNKLKKVVREFVEKVH